MISRLLNILLFVSTIYLLFLWLDERNTRLMLDIRQSLAKQESSEQKTSTITPSPTPSETPEVSDNKTSPQNRETLPTPTAETANTLSEMAIYGIESRISAIQKFNPLSDEQKERLYQKYKEESLARKRGEKANTESLEAIIGDSNAQFYRTQVQNAYQKAQEQEIDRDVFYLSRRLNLSLDQEQKYRKILSDLESNVSEHFKAERSSPQFASDPTFRVRLTIKEQQYRSESLSSLMKSILSPDQYQAYLQEEAESTNADMGIFHAP